MHRCPASILLTSAGKTVSRILLEALPILQGGQRIGLGSYLPRFLQADSDQLRRVRHGYRTREGMKMAVTKGKAATRLSYGYVLSQQRDANGDRIRGFRDIDPVKADDFTSLCAFRPPQPIHA